MFVEANFFDQGVDEVLIAASKVTDPIRNFKAVSECICKAGSKFTMEKSQIWVRQFQILKKTIFSKGVSGSAQKR